MRLAIFASHIPAFSFRVELGAHERPHPFHLFVGAFSLEGSLPLLSFAFCHLELLDLIVFGKFLGKFSCSVSLLLFVAIGSPLALPFTPISCSGFGVVVLSDLLLSLWKRGGRTVFNGTGLCPC